MPYLVGVFCEGMQADPRFEIEFFALVKGTAKPDNLLVL